MELLRGWSSGGRTSRWQVGLLLLFFFFFNAMALLQFSAAGPPLIVGKPVVFQFGSAPLTPENYTVTVPSGASVSQINSASNITCRGNFTGGDGDSEYLKLRGDYYPNAIGPTSMTGRCLYDQSVQLNPSACLPSPTFIHFGTMFKLLVGSPGNRTDNITFQAFQQLAFIITSDPHIADPSNQQTGNYVTVNMEFTPDAYLTYLRGHVGIYVNSPTSGFRNATGSSGDILTDASTVYVWIEYNTAVLNVYMNFDFIKPTDPTNSLDLDLTETLSQQPLYVGFSGSISNLSYNSQDSNAEDSPFLDAMELAILDWTFNSDGPEPDVLRDTDGMVVDPAAESKLADERRRRQQIILITAITIPSVLIFLLLVVIIGMLYKRNARLTALYKKYEIEEGILDRGPQNFKYKVLSAATKGFSSHELLGSGGFGSVYRGRLWLKGAEQPTVIAVKRISDTAHQGARQFLAEVKSIGEVQHRNLVPLLDWCHEKGELLLVYDYMPNGSVDQHLFKDTDASGEVVLTWSRRLKIVSGVATALAYLHEECEQRVIHRDVKSSNVMLDRDFNARLGDFGLARLSAHDQAPPSTAVLAGTYGYLAPEMAHTLKATEKTDVYSFGAMVLEVATGKRPILSYQDQQASSYVSLVDWVWSLYRNDILLEAADSRLQNAFDSDEMIMFLKIGLLCSHPDPNERPNMREVVNIWKGSTPFPQLPRTKPVPTFTLSIDDFDTEPVTIYTDDYGHSHESIHQLPLLRQSDGHSTFITSSKDDEPPPHAPEWRRGSSSMPPLRYRPSATSLII